LREERGHVDERREAPSREHAQDDADRRDRVEAAGRVDRDVEHEPEHALVEDGLAHLAHVAAQQARHVVDRLVRQVQQLAVERRRVDLTHELGDPQRLAGQPEEAERAETCDVSGADSDATDLACRFPRRS